MVKLVKMRSDENIDPARPMCPSYGSALLPLVLVTPRVILVAVLKKDASAMMPESGLMMFTLRAQQ